MLNLLKIQKRGISKYSQTLNFETSKFFYITLPQYKKTTNSISSQNKKKIKKILEKKKKMSISIFENFMKRDDNYEENPNDLIIDIEKFSFKNFYLREYWTNPNSDHYIFLSVISTLIFLYLILLFKKFLLKNFKVENRERGVGIGTMEAENWIRVKKRVKRKFKDVLDEFEDLSN